MSSTLAVKNARATFFLVPRINRLAISPRIEDSMQNTRRQRITYLMRNINRMPGTTGRGNIIETKATREPQPRPDITFKIEGKQGGENSLIKIILGNASPLQSQCQSFDFSLSQKLREWSSQANPEKHQEDGLHLQTEREEAPYS